MSNRSQSNLRDLWRRRQPFYTPWVDKERIESEVDRSLLRESRDHWRRLCEERQEAIDTAMAALNSSQYVGGPSEREAWRIVTDALGPFETQHIEAGDGR